jgi:hypothetical protein
LASALSDTSRLERVEVRSGNGGSSGIDSGPGRGDEIVARREAAALGRHGFHRLETSSYMAERTRMSKSMSRRGSTGRRRAAGSRQSISGCAG